MTKSSVTGEQFEQPSSYFNKPLFVAGTLWPASDSDAKCSGQRRVLARMRRNGRNSAESSVLLISHRGLGFLNSLGQKLQ